MYVTLRVLSVSIALAFVVPTFAQERRPDLDLMNAIQKSDLPAIKRSIAAGADVNVSDKTGTTPLMYAAAYSDVNCMRMLLNRGAAPNVVNKVGATALMWSAGDLGKVRLLLSRGADVNAQANSGRTPLMIASSYAGNVDAVKLLLARGARVKITAATGGPVFAAANAGDEAVLQALVAAGEIRTSAIAPVEPLLWSPASSAGPNPSRCCSRQARG